MVDSTAIRMHAEPGRGMYESFYFRGTSEDGKHAFWLKHNMLRYRGSGDVWLECALILFDGEGGNAHWDLQVRGSGMELMPFPHETMYRLPWPANKTLTSDCHVDFHG